MNFRVWSGNNFPGKFLLPSNLAITFTRPYHWRKVLPQKLTFRYQIYSISHQTYFYTSSKFLQTKTVSLFVWIKLLYIGIIVIEKGNIWTLPNTTKQHLFISQWKIYSQNVHQPYYALTYCFLYICI